MQPQALQSLPTELRTPPLPLIALVGSPEVHREFGVWATQVLRPPMVAMAVADANEPVLARLFGELSLCEFEMGIKLQVGLLVTGSRCSSAGNTRRTRPPGQTYACCNAAVPKNAGTKKPPKPFATPEGILKADWFSKQRQRRAAVALAFVER